MKSVRIFSLIISALLFLPFGVTAQQGAERSVDSSREYSSAEQTLCCDTLRPIAGRVGLVLAGGGAKGLYHIGVIRALEENNIPIDYISGTSMGAIVAALYAAGYTTDEMTEIVTSGAVEQWVSGVVDEKYRFHLNERPEAPSILSVYADVQYDSLKGKNTMQVRLPHSFVSTAQIDMALVELFSAATVACDGNFDNLMVPFRCIATDMNRHEPVEMRSGDLPFAVRASMAYPALFRPVTDNEGRVLVDGGCYDNFPWRILDKDFAPDFLIGSQCLDGIKPVTGESRLEKQIMALVTIPTDYSLPEDRGLIISRNVEAGLLEFDEAAQTIESGYADAMAKMEELQMRLISRRDSAEVESRRAAFREQMPELYFGEGSLSGLSPRAERYAETFLNFNSKKRKSSTARPHISVEKMCDRYYSLMATDVFDVKAFPVVSYDTLHNDFAINYALASKPQMRISIGGNLSSTIYNQIYLGLGLLSLGRTAQSGYLDVSLGPGSVIAETGGRTLFLGRTPMYIDYSIQVSRRSTLHGSFGHVTPISEQLKVRNTEPFISLGYGVATSRKSILELGVNGGYQFMAYEAGYDEDNVAHTHDIFRFVASRLRFQHSTLDKVLYPTKGNRFAASVIGVTGRDKWEIEPLEEKRRWRAESRSWVGAKVEWEHYPSNWNKLWFSVGYSLEAVYTNHPKFGTYRATTLTAPRYAPLPHSKMIVLPQFYANRYAAGGIMPTFALIKNLYLRGGFYAMLRDPLVADEYMWYMADLSAVYHTRIGAVSLSVTKYDLKSANNLFVTFNFGCPIFGKRGLYY